MSAFGHALETVPWHYVQPHVEITWKSCGLRSGEQVTSCEKSFYSTIELQLSSWTPTWTPLVHCYNIHRTTFPIRTTLTRYSVHFSPPTSKLHKVATLDCWQPVLSLTPVRLGQSNRSSQYINTSILLTDQSVYSVGAHYMATVLFNGSC